jgi:hypothetical protein
MKDGLMKVVSMRGKVVDMARLSAENADRVAVGNASMNARGDLLGPGGSVIATREQIARDYHASNPKAVKQVALRDLKQEVFVSPTEAVEQQRPKTKRKIADTD